MRATDKVYNAIINYKRTIANTGKDIEVRRKALSEFIAYISALQDMGVVDWHEQDQINFCTDAMKDLYVIRRKN